MISFLSNWIEQIAISVIIVSIFELILPNGNLKKYIKVVLGVYVIFCLISPFVSGSNLYDIGNIDLEQYIENVSKNETIVNQESMDARLQELYIEELKNDIEKRVEEKGYQMKKCNIDADLRTASDQPGIHGIDLILSENQSNIANIEKIEIGSTQNEEVVDDEKIEILKEELANYYEIDKEVINIQVK